MPSDAREIRQTKHSSVILISNQINHFTPFQGIQNKYDAILLSCCVPINHFWDIDISGQEYLKQLTVFRCIQMFNRLQKSKHNNLPQTIQYIG